MEEKRFNPISTSGVGFVFEHYVQAAYIASLILETPIPFSDGLIVNTVKFQAKQEAETDDLIATLSNTEETSKHYVQSKKGFEVNQNETFIKVVAAAFEDFLSNSFDERRDKFIVTTDDLATTDARDTLPMLEWARYSMSGEDFLKKLGGNKGKKKKYEQFKVTLQSLNQGENDDEFTWRFIKCFYIKSFDYISNSSKDTNVLKWFLGPHLKKKVSPDDALRHILEYVIKCNQHGASTQST